MTKLDVVLLFEIPDVEDEKQTRFDHTLREKLFKCNEEEYAGICESMEELGYYGVRLYPFCAKREDSGGLKKALLWIADNSELIKRILDEYSTSIQLCVKFWVGDSWADVLGVSSGYPLELAFSPNDLELLKEHKISIKVTAEYCDSIDD